MFNVASGLMLFDESRFYKKQDLIMLLASTVLCIVGVRMICLKDHRTFDELHKESSSKLLENR